MKGVMSPCWNRALLIVLSLVALSNAGPLGPLPNVTSSDVGLKEGSCVLGDVVYMAGDTFAGATPCERCACAAGSVRCAQERCEPRPGCKALHRPDHCCPTYQCECEQEGRVYGNGEKLVDPEDPCRLCYCQGGEVVCRRIACFVRNDCQPRLVEGRCCPEYDNCPLRGITAIPGLVPPVTTVSTTENTASSGAPSPLKENIKKEITIKEITPVSEIPVMTDVKIKEILPSPSIEVPEYPSSKSPLIPREAIHDKTVTTSGEISSKTEESVVIELISPLPTEQSSKPAESSPETKSAADSPPSKISFSTQDSINSEIYPSHVPTIIATMGVPPLTPDSVPAASSTRVTIIEEEDTSLFDHNPAFPPIPDDLSVVGTHEDDLVSEHNSDGDHHIANVHGEEHVAATPPPTDAPTPKEVSSTTTRDITETISTTTIPIEKAIVDVISTTTTRIAEDVETSTAYVAISTTVQSEVSKGSPMLNLRSAIPTEILTVESSVPEDINGELDDPEESVTAFEEPYTVTSTTTNMAVKLEDDSTVAPQVASKDIILPRSDEVTNAPFDTTTQTTQKLTEAPEIATSTMKALEEFTTSSVSKSNIATEITSQTEFSSLPIETSDQNPHDSSESILKERSPFTTEAPSIVGITTSKVTSEPNEITTIKATPSSPTTSENQSFENIEITTSKVTPEPNEITTTKATPTSSTTPENQSFENIETTEFILTSFGSSESSTDTVELIKITPTQAERNAAIIDSSHGKKTNVLTDLINLVGDVASISDHTNAPEIALRTTTSNSISDSEELMPVNAGGYKSKINNFNLNSITEIPLKTKNQLPVNKQKVVEIEDEDTDSIADAPPPHDKVEPTTRRPIIDNVSDSVPKNKTEKTDIEIISQSYVPTINRRPTKVVMKKSNDNKPQSEVTAEGPTLATVPSEVVTSSPDEVTPSADVVTESALTSDNSTTMAESAVVTDTTTTSASAQ